jgi:hypothetical protein
MNWQHNRKGVVGRVIGRFMGVEEKQCGRLGCDNGQMICKTKRFREEDGSVVFAGRPSSARIMKNVWK